MSTDNGAEEEVISSLRSKIENEPITSFLKSEILELSPGHSLVRLEMRPEFQNFHGIIFGGIIMSLADQAFGSASNSMAYPSVASQFNTYFISSAKVGDVLTAEGKVVKSGRKAGFSEVVITNQDGKLIAKATGMTIRVG